MIPALQPVQSSRWNQRLAGHLLNRAGFGVPRKRVETLASKSPDEAVSSLVDFQNPSDRLRQPSPDKLPPNVSRQELREKIKDLPYKKKRNRRQTWRRTHRKAVKTVLRNWWLRRMIRTPNPLQEKLTLFWHGHFATSARKVRNVHYNLRLNQLFRRNAAGNFRELTRNVGKSPAMLRYLDNFRSRKQNPNENWARELMELFTMGLGHYTEKDVKESARAFTGWTIEGSSFTFRKNWHDDGKKTFLGQTGHFDGDDIIDIIFEQPEPSRFIIRNLWRYFVYPDPDERIVRELAALLRLCDYELRPVLKRMFLSREFYSDRAIGALVKSPVQFVVSLFGEIHPKRVGKKNQMNHMRQTLKRLGQRLFFPPNVNGWEGNRGWIDTNKLLYRYNAAGRFLRETDPVPEVKERLKPVDGNTVKEAIRILEKTFLAVSLDQSQKKEIARSLTGSRSLDQPFDLKQVSTKQLHRTVQLILSTAEFQLC